jgi:tetratricopeptide (TPR) repeat protein
MLVVRKPETTSIASKATTDGLISIAPGSSTRRDLSGGAKEVFVIPIDIGKLLRFSIDKGDHLLSTTLYGPTETKLVEHVSEDFEVVEISFPADVAGIYRIELQSLETTHTRSQYELRVQPLKTVTPLDRKDSEARQAMAHAGRLRANWTEASFRHATEQFDKAVSIWTSAADFAAAANASLKSGDVYFLFGDYKKALERYQSAEALAIKAGDWFAQARALSRIGRLQSYVGKNVLAQKQLTKAFGLFKERESKLSALAANAYGEVLSNLAEVTYAKGDFITSSELLDEALKIFENNRKGQARVHLFMSYIAGGSGDPETAAAQIGKALELYRAVNDKRGEGLALTTLGLSRTSKGDTNEAIKRHHEAIEIFRAIGDQHSEAVALNALGQVYYILNDHALALVNYEQALRLFESIGTVDGVVSTFKMAQVNRKRGDLDRALADLERCLKLSRAAKKVRTEVIALNEIASIYVSQNHSELALRQYQKIYKFYQSIRDYRGQATALNTYGDLLLQGGHKQKALDAYRRALSLSREVDDKGILLTALYNVARANLELGLPERALSVIRESLEIIEHLRANVGGPDFRLSYFS